MFGKKAFFRMPKHQQFHYKPMHYDPQKEELESRVEQLKDLQEDSLEGAKARIASGIRSSHLGNETYRKQLKRRSAFIFVAVIVMLIILSYFLLSVYLPELMKFLA